MRKLKSRTLPGWAWLSLLVITPVLELALIRFLIDESKRQSALLELLTKTSEAGLLSQPEIQTQVGAMAGGANSILLLSTCIGLAVLLNLVIVVPWWRERLGKAAGA